MNSFSKTMLLTSFVAAIAFAGCKKDETPDPTPTPTPQPSTGIASLNTFFSQQGVQSQFFTVSNNSTQTLTGTRGTTVGFNANSFVTLSGAPVTGNITIELKEIYDKKTMLLSDVSTNAQLYPGGPKEPLISGGEFYVNAKQGNTQLKLAPGYTYNVFLPSATAPSAQMSLFDGETATSGIEWTPNQDSAAALYGSAVPQGYFAYCDSLKWGNADQFMNSPTYTTITMNIGGTFDASQMRAYVWYDNLNGIWSCWDAYDAVSGTLSDSHTATGPAHLIVVSVKNGLLYTAILGATITANGVYNLTLTQTTEAAFTAALTALP